MSPTGTLRLFFALWPEESLQRSLATAVREALGQDPPGQPMPVRNLHVTLAFLGSVPEERVQALRAAAAPAARAAAPPLTLEFRQLRFWRRAQLVCASPAPCAGADSLAQSLRQCLHAAGFSPDEKPFRPHVTLARRAELAPARSEFAPVTWSFSAFALVRSRTEPTGSVYSVLDSWTLCGQ